MKFPHKTIQPDKILDTVKNQIRSLSTEVSNSELLDDLGISTRSDCAEENQPDRPDTCTQNEQETTVLDNITIDKDSASENGSTKRFESQEDLAEKVVKAGGVKFVEDLKAYMVEGVGGRKYSVTLHPKEECHCPSTATCYHIMAAKLFIGMTIKSEKEEWKLVSVMRYKSRPRSQKKIGQKKPKKTDFEIVPAPDSKQALEMHLENSPIESPIVSNVSDNSQSERKSTKKRSCLKKTTHQLQDSHNKDEVKAADTEAHELSTSKRRRRSVKRLNFDRSPDKANTPNNSKRVRLCIPDGPQLNCEDFIDLDNIQTPVTSPVKNVASPWLPELNLTVDDRNIITKDEWLTEKHMLAVSNVLKTQFPLINGLQDTSNTPYFIDDKQFWNTSKHFEPQESPCAQIHFDGRNHWTMSFATKSDDRSVYYIDSLGVNLKDLKNCVKIQLSQIYKSSSKLQVKIPRVQQQPNSHDCGLFAIANIVEFCFSPESFNTRIIYSVSKMRQHLIECLEKGKMSPFPREKERGRCKLDSYTCKIVNIPVWCCCKMPECVDNMIYCGNRKCKTWFHKICLKLESVDSEWQCPSCKQLNK